MEPLPRGANFQRTKLLWEIVGRHNDFLEAGRERYLDGLNKFLALLENSRPAPKQEHHR